MTAVRNLLKKISIILSIAMVYYLFFLINESLFSFTEFSTGVHWVYLPSGIIFIAVLIFSELGVIGIALATVLIYHSYYFKYDLFTAVCAGMYAGMAIWLTRCICMRTLKINASLDRLSAIVLLKAALLFSVIGAVARELWFVWTGHGENMVDSAAVTVVGTFLGIIIVLYTAKALIILLARLARNRL
jgi:hypothetical protein